MASAGFNFDTLSLTEEGVQSITWGTGDNDKVLETKITLDAHTVSAGQYLVLGLLFDATSWTLAQNSFWSAHLIDE